MNSLEATHLGPSLVLGWQAILYLLGTDFEMEISTQDFD